MATEVHYTAEEAEQAFLRAGNELTVIKCRLAHLLHVFDARFGLSHKLTKRMWTLYEKIRISLCGELDSAVCNYYPRGTGSIGGVFILEMFYRTDKEPNPFHLYNPSVGVRRRMTKQLLPEEGEYFLNTLRSTKKTMQFIINNQILFGVRSFINARNVRDRISDILREVDGNEGEE